MEVKKCIFGGHPVYINVFKVFFPAIKNITLMSKVILFDANIGEDSHCSGP